MKLFSFNSSRRAPVFQTAAGGFTLPEMMTAMAIFSLLIGAVVSSQVFGLRLYKISETKLTNTGEARQAFNRVRNEIWSGKILRVGNGDAYSFNLLADGTPHVGNALRIYPTTDTNNYVYYYVDAADTCLKRMVSGSKKIEVVADYVTNSIAFQAEDFQGNIRSNYAVNRIVIRMNLQFYQHEYAVAQLKNSGWLGDYYQLQTRVARRAID